MTDFVLVHGAWHGGWCWHKVKAFLEDRGHRVVAPDLPGHGDDPGDVRDATMDNYADRVIGHLDECDEPVVLVGHSMGGCVISLVAEAVPDKITRLVFVAAFLPDNGESIMDIASTNLASALRDNLEFSDDMTTVTVSGKIAQQAFYHDCEADDVSAAVSRLRPQNAAVFSQPLHLSHERFGSVPKQYIECVEDQAVNIALQRWMARRGECLVNTLQTSHSPFFSAPAALASFIAWTGIKDDKG